MASLMYLNWMSDDTIQEIYYNPKIIKQNYYFKILGF